MISDFLSRGSPLLSRRLWTAAVAQHERVWEEWERKFCKAARDGDTDAMRTLSHPYAASRTISRNVWSRFLKLILSANVKGKHPQKRLYNFADHVEKIACQIGRHQSNGRPLSAASKFLLPRHPKDGFIYDKNAREVIQKICGAPTNSDALQRYRDFVKSYSDLFCELRGGLIKILDKRDSKLDATRIIDKFLWLQGTSDADKRVKTLVKGATKEQRKIASKIVSWLKSR
jgi:hypothetical protein